MEVFSSERRRRHDYFMKVIQKRLAQIKDVHRIILIGTGESGKSTFVKQMKLLSSYNHTFPDAYRDKFIPEIQRNLVDSLAAILGYMEQCNIPFTGSPGPLNKAKHHIQQIKETIDRTPDAISQFTGTADSAERHLFRTTCRKLWADAAVRHTLTRGNEFQLIDCAQYFLDKIDDICDAGYRPSDDDVLHSRTKTLGIHTESIIFNNVNFELVDVGGQREQRAKWIEAMSDGVTAVIFLTDISAYDMMLAEDNSVNRLRESINLLGQVWTKSPLKDKSIILFLNKQDKLERKVREQRTQLETYFPEYKTAKSQFIIDLLREIKEARVSKQTKEAEVWQKYFGYFLPVPRQLRDSVSRRSNASDAGKASSQEAQTMIEYNQIQIIVSKAFSDNLAQGWLTEISNDDLLIEFLLTKDEYQTFQWKLHAIPLFQVVSITTFIQKLFLAQCDQSAVRHVYPFPTTAIDKRNVDRVFESCKDILQGKALTELIT